MARKNIVMVQMKYIEAYQSVKKLLELLSDLNEKLPTYLVGLGGELLVKSKLMENNIPLVPKGGQAGFDIVLQNTQLASLLARANLTL